MWLTPEELCCVRNQAAAPAAATRKIAEAWASARRARSLRTRRLPPPQGRIITLEEEWAGTESPRDAGEPKRKAKWWTEAPIPHIVLRTARTPSPGGRMPPGRHTTPYLATPQRPRNSARSFSRVVASRQDATGAGPPTSSYLLATPQALRNSARCAATGQPETGLDNKP